MPTWAVDDSFWGDYRRLSPEEREAFKTAKMEFSKVLKDWESGGCVGLPRFPAKLGITRMVNNPGVFELAWAGDGRATWQFGLQQIPGRFTSYGVASERTRSIRLRVGLETG
jgi:hypothetical protein